EHVFTPTIRYEDLHMSITTGEFVPGTEVGVAEEVQHECHFGLKDLSKALLGLLTSYLVLIAVLIAAVATIVFVVMSVKAGKLARGDAATILLAGAGVVFLAFIFTGWAILRNKWRCLMNAPERGGAKWWMFASMVCIFATPALNFVGGIMGGYSSGQTRAQQMAALEHMTADKYMASLKTGNTEAYMRLAGAAIGPLGGMFFILFLRAVALTVQSWILARLAEVHLVLDIVMLIASFIAIFDMSRLHFVPHVWLTIGLGSLISFVLWLVLIIGIIVKINVFLGSQRSPLEEEPQPMAW
ncbi:MAG TPA: hypothetical protein VFA18_06820, partial [Gemmataceae bacterium]|nr:hypothetical protein [Gemmataceae bacterium]